MSEIRFEGIVDRIDAEARAISAPLPQHYHQYGAKQAVLRFIRLVQFIGFQREIRLHVRHRVEAKLLRIPVLSHCIRGLRHGLRSVRIILFAPHIINTLQNRLTHLETEVERLRGEQQGGTYDGK